MVVVVISIISSPTCLGLHKMDHQHLLDGVDDFRHGRSGAGAPGHVLGDLGNLEMGGVLAKKKSVPDGNGVTWLDIVQHGK